MPRLTDSMRDNTDSGKPLEGGSDPATDANFLSRWSRRKSRRKLHHNSPDDTLVSGGENHTAVLDAEEHGSPGSQITDDPVAEVSAVDETAVEQQEPLLSDADMPPVASLTGSSDVSPFFNRGVSRELRKTALRHLFSLPALNITDGLNDYDEDYTSFEPLGETITCDMHFHTERKQRLAEEAAAKEAAAEPVTEEQPESADDSAGEDNEAETAAQSPADESSVADDGCVPEPDPGYDDAERKAVANAAADSTDALTSQERTEVASSSVIDGSQDAEQHL